MSRRVALVAALTIVFAPGWQPGATEDGRDGEILAARVLAPGFHEGVLRDSAADSKRLDGRVPALGDVDARAGSAWLSQRPMLRRLSAVLPTMSPPADRPAGGSHEERAPPPSRQA